MQYYDPDTEEDEEFSDEEDDGDPDEPATVPCPHCGEDVYDDAERCPYCESYLSREDAPRRQPRWAVVAVVIMVIVLFVAWVINGT